MKRFIEIQGSGRTQDHCANLAAAIVDLCYEKGDGMALAAVLGCLDIAKHELIVSQRGDEDK